MNDVKRWFGEIEGAVNYACINLDKLENMVLGNPYVSSCEVFPDHWRRADPESQGQVTTGQDHKRERPTYFIDQAGCHVQ